MDRGVGFRSWKHPAPRAVFLLVHGLGAHTGRWEMMAEYFLGRGVSCYAVELPRDGCFREYFADILRLRAVIAGENPSKKIFLAGESMGALIAFLLAARTGGLFAGLILLSPAFANRVSLPLSDLAKIALALFCDPGRSFGVPFDSSMCTRDAGYRKTMDADPAEYRSSPARLLADLLFHQALAGSVRSVGMPSLFLVAGDDRIVDCRATRRIFGRLDSRDKKLVEFPGMFHALSIDTGREAVFEEIARWAGERF